MTKKGRNILFSFLVILFLIAAPITVSYSLGWRFDWQTKKIIQPGIFYFKVLPKSAEIFLDGKLKKRTDFFFGSVLIENLFPRTYEVEIRKGGFHSWKKNLEVKERGVTEAKNIVLIPENPSFEVLNQGVKELFFSQDEKKIIIKEGVEEEWTLKLFEIEKNLKSHLIAKKDISRMEVDLIDLTFSPDSKRIILKTGTKERLMFYLLELDEVPIALTQVDFLDIGIEKLYFNPQNPQKLIVLEAGKISEVDLINKKTTPPILENIIVYSVSENNIYYLDNSGFIFKTDFSFSLKDRLNIVPFPVKKEIPYQIIMAGSRVFLKESDILYIFDENKKSFEKISDSVKNLKISPDSKKLAYFNNYEIWVLFLEKITETPQKEAGDKLFLTRFSEKIDNVFWFTNHYLIFNAGDKIKVAEIDDRDRINIVDLVEFKNPRIFWVDKKLYVFSEENLYVSEGLIP